MMQIVLVHPQIPPNTGQVARLCAATGAALHLVRPLGFKIDDRSLRRAGLDYWDHVDLRVHDSLDRLFSIAPPDTCWYFSKSGDLRYDQIVYTADDWLIFGSETHGLPVELMEARRNRLVRVPVQPGSVRSLNLASTASIVLYEALRQNGFSGMGDE